MYGDGSEKIEGFSLDSPNSPERKQFVAGADHLCDTARADRSNTGPRLTQSPLFIYTGLLDLATPNEPPTLCSSRRRRKLFAGVGLLPQWKSTFLKQPHDLPYPQVAEALQLELSGVEKWIIDASSPSSWKSVIREGLRDTFADVVEPAYYADVQRAQTVAGRVEEVAGRVEDGPRERTGGGRGGTEAGHAAYRGTDRSQLEWCIGLGTQRQRLNSHRSLSCNPRASLVLKKGKRLLLYRSSKCHTISRTASLGARALFRFAPAHMVLVAFSTAMASRRQLDEHLVLCLADDMTVLFPPAVDIELFASQSTLVSAGCAAAGPRRGRPP
ncbi:hypothetical protein FB451DRAFT_1363407 [Mycena latifolia]|nr:hypothetical protein FB451DRAFT_1363407 [Mycena latifolia]